MDRGKVVRSTRAMLVRVRDNKEEELLALQKELDAFEESAQTEAENAEGGDGEETHAQGNEEHHEKNIAISKGVTGSRNEELAFKKPKEIHVRSEKKRDS